METYRTPNFSLAGYFSHEGYCPNEILRTGSMRSRPGSSVYAFCYLEEQFDELKDLEKKFFTGKAKVDPKKFEFEKKSLKEMIDNEEEMNRYKD